MCGIAGIVSRDANIDKETACRKMTSKMGHRGPDYQDVVSDDFVSFGHARLSILDLSADANQPFWNQDKSLLLVFNGEIYNHHEIRKSLKDYEFKTSSDTETLIYAWQEWGTSCVEKLEGMFAFAMYDLKAGDVFLVRDRLGIKPLYYHSGDSAFIFASETRSIAASKLIDLTISEKSTLEMLQYQAVHSFKSVFNEIDLLPPACVLQISDGSQSLHEYWKPTDGGVYDIGYDEAKSKTKELLFEAVEKRMISDVPLGAFLSGGIDSSAIVAIMSELSQSPVNTFSVTFDEPEFSEKEFSDLIASKYKTQHHEVRLKADDFLELVPNAIQAIDQPSADGVNTYVVSKYTKEAGLTVALSGLGGDELFLGYPLFKQTERLYSQRWLYSFPQWMRSIIASYLSKGKDLRKLKLAEFIRKEAFSIENIYPDFRKVFPREEMSRISSKSHAEAYPIQLFEEYLQNFNIPMQSKLSILELKGYLHSVLLKDTDQMSMAHSLEVRVPFIDHKLVEFILRLPDQYKFGEQTKNLLVESIGPLLPNKLVNRPKMGFVLPWEQWLKSELKDFGAKGIEQLQNVAFLNFDHIQSIWSSFQKGEQTYSWSRVWPFIILGHYLAKHE